MTVEIRPAGQGDAETLAELCMGVQELHVEMQPTLFRHATRQELAGFFRERLADADFPAFLALADGAPVGYVVLHVVRRPADVLIKPRSHVEIDQIHVAEGHRRQGIGRLLAATAVETARAHGIEVVQLNVWAQNSRAVAAFKAMGFEPQRHTMVLERGARLGPAPPDGSGTG